MHDDAKETHPSSFAQTAQILTMRSTSDNSCSRLNRFLAWSALFSVCFLEEIWEAYGKQQIWVATPSGSVTVVELL